MEVAEDRKNKEACFRKTVYERGGPASAARPNERGRMKVERKEEKRKTMQQRTNLEGKTTVGGLFLDLCVGASTPNPIRHHPVARLRTSYSPCPVSRPKSTDPYTLEEHAGTVVKRQITKSVAL